MKKRICQIAIALLTVSMLTVGASAAQTSCTSINSLLTQLLIEQLECRGILPPGWNTGSDEEEPPVVIPPGTEEPADPEPPEEPDDETDGILAYELEVVKLVNDIRASYGLNKLTVNAELCEIARLKSEDMKRNNYFDHTSPTYGSPFEMLLRFGVSYRSAGENIAYGYTSPQAVVNAWMNSEGHRENILRASFTEIGVGYYQNGNYWTQLFIG